MKESKEVQDMRTSLAEARRAARGVKDSARKLRVVRKNERLSEITKEAMIAYDAEHPPRPSDDTTKRL